MNFFDTDAGQHAAAAKEFLEGASTLDEAQRQRGRILFRPTLALAGQGLELMLKSVMLLNGRTPPRGWQGHQIRTFWSLEECEPVRGNVFVNAGIVAEYDRTSGIYPDVPSEEEVMPIIETIILDLADLHGGGRYPLRYPSDENRQAPRTPFLVRTLWRTADDLVKRPSDFKLVRFRGED